MNTAMKDDGTLRRRITVEEYYRMAEVGLLAPDARVELIDGEIIDMAPIGSRHGGTVIRLNRLVARAVGDRAILGIQHFVRLDIFSEPQPDVVLLKSRPDDYTISHASPAEILLIVEVCDTSLRHDLKVKVPLYARHGIPEVWIVDLEGEQVRVFRSPAGAAYTKASVHATPGVLDIEALPGVTLDLSEIFGT